jgi:uncharacterized protein with PIN domain
MAIEGEHLRLLCDEMLSRLGRWLRAAGYDTAIAESGSTDAVLLEWCRREDRTLLTRDRHLAGIAEREVSVLALNTGNVGAQALALRQALGIDWLYAPFTRCVVDNAPLAPVPAEMVHQVPLSRAAGGPLYICPTCRRLYWPGGHVRRMQARLAEWNR